MQRNCTYVLLTNRFMVSMSSILSISFMMGKLSKTFTLVTSMKCPVRNMRQFTVNLSWNVFAKRLKHLKAYTFHKHLSWRHCENKQYPSQDTSKTSSMAGISHDQVFKIKKHLLHHRKLVQFKVWKISLHVTTVKASY